jgi:hypothetical protein
MLANTNKISLDQWGDWTFPVTHHPCRHTDNTVYPLANPIKRCTALLYILFSPVQCSREYTWSVKLHFHLHQSQKYDTFCLLRYNVQEYLNVTKNNRWQAVLSIWVNKTKPPPNNQTLAFDGHYRYTLEWQLLSPPKFGNDSKLVL